MKKINGRHYGISGKVERWTCDIPIKSCEAHGLGWTVPTPPLPCAVLMVAVAQLFLKLLLDISFIKFILIFLYFSTVDAQNNYNTADKKSDNKIPKAKSERVLHKN